MPVLQIFVFLGFAAVGDVLTIQYEEVVARSRASIDAPGVFLVVGGAQVEILEETANWSLIARPDESAALQEDVDDGWVHRIAFADRMQWTPLSEEELKRLRKRAERIEIALAGRSFDGRVRERLRNRKRDFEDGYAVLDAAAEEPAREDLAAFRREGGLPAPPDETPNGRSE